MIEESAFVLQEALYSAGNHNLSGISWSKHLENVTLGLLTSSINPAIPDVEAESLDSLFAHWPETLAIVYGLIPQAELAIEPFFNTSGKVRLPKDKSTANLFNSQLYGSSYIIRRISTHFAAHNYWMNLSTK